MKQMMKWQLHQLDHMNIICMSLQTDNHATSSPLRFLQAGYALPDAQPTYVKALKATDNTHTHHTTTPQPFYGPLSGTTRVSQCQNRTSGLYGATEN